MTDPKARFDLDAAKAAVENQSGPQTGFFVFSPDDGPHLRPAAERDMPTGAHADQFRTELRSALKGGAVEKPGGEVYASAAPEAPSAEAAPAPAETKSDFSILRPDEAAKPALIPGWGEAEKPKKKKMTVRRFLLGF